MLTQIINGRILTPQGWLKDGSIIIRDNKILEVTNCDLAIIGANIIDAKGMYVVPGGIEMHVHGGGGRDFQEGTEEAFRTAIEAHAKHGSTSIFPTLSSSTVPMIEQAVETCNKLMAEPDSVSPMAMTIGPVTTGGKKRITFSVPNIFSRKAITKYSSDAAATPRHA